MTIISNAEMTIMCNQNVYLTAHQRELKNTSSTRDIRKRKSNAQQLSYDKYRHSHIGAHVLKNSGPRNAHGMNYVRICRNSINFLSPKRMFSSGLASPGIACTKSTNRIASSSLGEIG